MSLTTVFYCPGNNVIAKVCPLADEANDIGDSLLQIPHQTCASGNKCLSREDVPDRWSQSILAQELS